MKKVREYPMVCPHDDDPKAYQKTTYMLTEDELAYLEEELESGNFINACRNLTGLYDGWQGPGGRYWRFYFNLTPKKKYLSVEEETGMDW